MAYVQTAVYNLTLGEAGTAALGTGLGSETVPRMVVQADGKHVWSSGSATADTNLYRGGADTLQTDDSLVVGGTIKASNPFSKSLVLVPPTVTTHVVWRAPAACTVTAVRGYRVGGTGATITALNGVNDVLISALSLTSAATWLSSTAVQNTAISAGSTVSLQIISLAGSPTSLTIQLDLVAA